MNANILNKILNSEIPVERIIEWLETDNDTTFPDIEQTDSTKIEFIGHFLDYLRKQCHWITCLTSDNELETQYPKTFHNVSSQVNVNHTVQVPIEEKLINGTEFQSTNTEASRSPIVVPSITKNTICYCPNATTLNVSTAITSSPIQTEQVPGILQYDSPLSHSSPLKNFNYVRLEAKERSFSQEGCNILQSPQSINDSCISNLSINSTIPCSPISPFYAHEKLSIQSETPTNRKSAKSSKTPKSPAPKTNSSQKNKKHGPNRSICLGDFIQLDKSNSKQKSKSDSPNQSIEQSPVQANKLTHTNCSNVTPPNKLRSRRRIKPTKIVLNTNKESEQETFGVVTRSPSTNPTFLEALSADETNNVASFEDERELLKLQRQKQLSAIPEKDSGAQEPRRTLIESNHAFTVVPSSSLVDNKNILDILAQLHGGFLIKNLAPNPMRELYFIISLLNFQYKMNSTTKKIQIHKQSDSIFYNDAESFKQLKQTMGCEELVDDSSNENIKDSMTNTLDKDDSLSTNELNERLTTQTLTDNLHYLNTVHNCVYFATAVLWNAKNILSVFDRATVALLTESPLVKTFHSPLQEYLCELYEEKCLQSKNNKPYNNSRTLQSNVCFQVDTDNRENFPSTLAFSKFRRQRDLFYEILKTWEDNKHLQKRWCFQKILGNKINAMISMHPDAVNYYHVARLFKSQLLMSSIVIGQTEDSASSADLEVLKSLKDLNPQKLQQLQNRLITPVVSLGPVPPPSFPGVQEFYKEFLLASSDPKFTAILQDCFIQEILELNDTQFTCSDIETKESKADESTKQDYLLCISSLKLLAKFLGFLISLPYQSGKNTLQSEKTQIALRSRIMPPLDLQECLYQALTYKKLSLTIPWVVQYLAMLDPVSFRLPFYLNICKSLYCIYRDTKYSPHDEITLLIVFSIGWLFELPNFPQDIYYLCVRNYSNQKTILKIDCTLYSQKNKFSTTDDTTSNLNQNNITFDELHIIDDRALYICCPYLKEFKKLLTSGNSTLNSNNAYRHITPVSSKLSQASSTTRTVSLQLQLEEAFFNGHPRSVRRTVDFIVERIVSSCVKFIYRTVIPTCKTKCFTAMKESWTKSVVHESKIHNIIESLIEKIRDECEIMQDICEKKTKTAMESLLADDVLSAVKDMCVKIAVRNELEQINQWLDSYINNAINTNRIISEFDSLRIDNEETHDTVMKKIEFDNPDIPWATTVIKDVRNSLWELLENNGRWSILTEEKILLNVNKIHQTLIGRKNIVPAARRVLYRISVDYAIYLIAYRSDLFTPNVEDIFFKIWKTYNNIDDNFIGKIFSGLMSPRNIRILMSNKDSAVWINYGVFIRRMLKHNLITMDEFSDDCVALLRLEWSPELLQSFSKCITEAISDYKSDGKFADKIVILLDWIIQTCGTMGDCNY